jgi:hypothetical protein
MSNSSHLSWLIILQQYQAKATANYETPRSVVRLIPLPRITISSSALYFDCLPPEPPSNIAGGIGKLKTGGTTFTPSPPTLNHIVHYTACRWHYFMLSCGLSAMAPSFQCKFCFDSYVSWTQHISHQEVPACKVRLLENFLRLPDAQNICSPAVKGRRFITGFRRTHQRSVSWAR